MSSRPYRNHRRRSPYRRPESVDYIFNEQLQSANGPGRFEGELLIAEFVCENDDGSYTIGGEDGSTAFSRIDGPFHTSETKDWESGDGRRLNRCERRFLKNCCGIILRYRSDGLVDNVVYYSMQQKEAFEHDWDNIVEDFEQDEEIDD